MTLIHEPSKRHIYKTTVVRKHRIRRSKLDGYQDIIEDKYAAGCSARSIYAFIVEKGFTGKYTIVKDYCRRFRKAQTKKATIRVEHTIGLSAQVDWKEQVTMTDRNGVSHTFSIFLYVLPYSKFKFLKLTLDQIIYIWKHFDHDTKDSYSNF